MRAIVGLSLALCPGVASACAVGLDSAHGNRGFSPAFVGLMVAPFAVVAGFAGASRGATSAAGAIGAAIVAGWFLLLDLARGMPLLTPALLGAAVFHGVTSPAGLAIAASPVVGYTVPHAVVFVAFGIVAASLLAASEEEPPAFIAFVVLFAAFEVFFFAALGPFGRSLLGALLWWAIFTVHPLRTPRLLGAAARAGGPDRRRPRLQRRARHRLRALRAGQRRPRGQRRRAADVPPSLVILYVAFEVFIFAVVLVLARWVFDELAGWAVVVGNLLAAEGMLTYYFTAHPRLVGQVRATLADEG